LGVVLTQNLIVPEDLDGIEARVGAGDDDDAGSGRAHFGKHVHDEWWGLKSFGVVGPGYKLSIVSDGFEGADTDLLSSSSLFNCCLDAIM
jgi:hypothetical protein